MKKILLVALATLLFLFGAAVAQAPTLSTNAGGPYNVNQEFTVNAQASDTNYVERIDIEIKNSNGQRVFLRMHDCDISITTCSTSFKFTINAVGNYQIITTAYDYESQTTVSTQVAVTEPSSSPQPQQTSSSTDSMPSITKLNVPFNVNANQAFTAEVSAGDNNYVERIDIEFIDLDTSALIARKMHDCDISVNTCDAVFSITLPATSKRANVRVIVYDSIQERIDTSRNVVIANSQTTTTTTETKTLTSSDPNAPTMNVEFPIPAPSAKDFETKITSTYKASAISSIEVILKNADGTAQMYRSFWDCDISTNTCVAKFIFRIPEAKNYPLDVIVHAMDWTDWKYSTVIIGDPKTPGLGGGSGGDNTNTGGGNTGGSGGSSSSVGSSSGGFSGGSSVVMLKAAFAMPAQIFKDEVTSFDASISTKYTGTTIIRYYWDFNGDGVFDTENSDPIGRYMYASEGTYKVTLRIQDNTGRTESVTNQIIVKGARSVASTASIGTSFAIKVTDTNGNPVSDAVVTLESAKLSYGRNTNTDGTVIVDVAADCYDITVKKEGHSFRTMKGVCITSMQTKNVIVKEAGSAPTGFFTKKGMAIAIPIAIILIVATIGLTLYGRKFFNQKIETV